MIGKFRDREFKFETLRETGGLKNAGWGILCPLFSLLWVIEIKFSTELLPVPMETLSSYKKCTRNLRKEEKLDVKSSLQALFLPRPTPTSSESGTSQGLALGDQKGFLKEGQAVECHLQDWFSSQQRLKKIK